MDFALDPRLAADTLPVARLALCEVRLMNRRTWPWLVLVPCRASAVELLDLPAADRALLMDELARAARALRAHARPDKLNIGALGNVVAQLHVHVVARWRSDPAWPGPVWGAPAGPPYGAGEGEGTAAALAALL